MKNKPEKASPAYRINEDWHGLRVYKRGSRNSDHRLSGSDAEKSEKADTATTRSGKPIAAAASPAYAQARRIWRQDGMAGASLLAEALERDYGHFSRRDHLDAADHHEQSQHDGSKADQACHRIAAWSHQMAADADTDMQQAVQDTKKSLAEVTGLLKTYIKAMPAARNASRPKLSLRKAAGHTYTSRERAADGSWRYHYAGDAHEGIGKTQSGKTVPHPGSGEYRNHMPGETKFADYSQQDHADAHKLHAEAGKKLAAEADDIQHAYATRHGNTSVRENSQQADASAAHFRSATAARTMAQAHVDAAVTHARLGGMAKSADRIRAQAEGRANPHARRTLTVKSLSKAESGPGSRGGTVIGKTRSGKIIYESHSHPEHASFSKQDHMDAAGAHDAKAKTSYAAFKEHQASTPNNVNAQWHDSQANKTAGLADKHRVLADWHRAKANSFSRKSLACAGNSPPEDAQRRSAAGVTKSQTRRTLTMKSLSKAAGDRGGVVIGKTRSGRPVYQSHDHSVAMKPSGAVSEAQQAGNAQRVKNTNPKFTAADHADAAAFHDQHAEQAKREAKTYSGASHNTQGPMYKQAMRTAAMHSALSAAHASHASSDEQDKGLAHASVSAKQIARHGLEGAQRRSGAGAAKSQTRSALTMKSLSKADGHKYQSREMGAGGHWKYTYGDGASSGAGKTSASAYHAARELGRSKDAAEYSEREKALDLQVQKDHPGLSSSGHGQMAAYHTKKADKILAQNKKNDVPRSDAAHIQNVRHDMHRELVGAHARLSQKTAKSQTRRHANMNKSLTDPLGDITVESVYAPMGFARISDVDGKEIKTDAGSIDELAALVADMQAYNAGTVVGGVQPAQRDKSTVPPAEEPPLVPQSTTIDASGNAPSNTPETEVVTKSCAALHSTLAAQWADAQSIVMGMPTFLPPDAPEGDARFSLIGQ